MWFYWQGFLFVSFSGNVLFKLCFFTLYKTKFYWGITYIYSKVKILSVQHDKIFHVPNPNQGFEHVKYYRKLCITPSHNSVFPNYELVLSAFEIHINGITQYVLVFQVLSVNARSVKSFIFMCSNSFSLLSFSIPLYENILIYLSILLLINIWVVFCFWLLIAKV